MGAPVQTTGILLGVGNPLLDIEAHVDQSFLSKYNLQANNAILADETHIPIFSDLIQNHKVEYIAGGSTQNVMRGAQWLLPADSSSYIGCIGDDEYGRALERAAKADGLKTAYLIDNVKATGTCAVLITGQDRSLVANLSAANDYKEEHLEVSQIWDIVAAAKFIYVGGFFLTVSPPSIMRLAKHCAETNKVFMMNLNAPFLSQFYKTPMDEASPYWDIIFGNESEAEAFAETHAFGTKDVKEIAIKLTELPKVNKLRSRMAVITQGALPTILAFEGKLTEFPVIPIKKEDIVDTNGAGDAFVGGFLSQYVQGKSLEACMKAGNFVANGVIQRSGCTFPKEKPSVEF